jgi:hypothetical protein
VCKREINLCPINGGVCLPNEVGAYECSPDGCVEQPPCFEDICDFAINDRVGYCEKLVCPQIDGLIEKNGRCFIKACPDGSLDFDGECRMDE